MGENEERGSVRPFPLSDIYEGRPGNSGAARRIVLCHLESLTCLPALNLLFGVFGAQIGLVVSSRRFGEGHGGFFNQLVQTVRRSGIRMTFWLGFDLISAQVVSALARWQASIGQGQPALATLPALARRHGARLIETGDINAPETVEVIRAFAPDAVVVMNFDQILHPPVVEVPRIGVVNIHPSLLPSLRGPCPVFWALAERRAVSGVTLHLIENARIDAGAILHQIEMPLDRRSSVAEVNTQLFLAGAGALEGTLERLSMNAYRGRPQDPSAGQYRGFPSRAEMATAHAQGVQLCGLWHVVRLIAATLGIGRATFHRLS